MRIIYLILSFAFISITVFSQTVIKTHTNRGKNKNITVKTNNKNSKKVIVKTNTAKNNIIVKTNRDRLVINKPNRPKVIKKRFKKKRRGYVWVKGFWKWSPIFRIYFWQDGYWLQKRRNHIWVDGYWEETINGYFWVDGYWFNQF
jgi:hypothetical protein